MAKATECVPVDPFKDWLNDLAESLGSLTLVCEKIGWGTGEPAQRRLYRYRRGLTEGGRGSKKFGTFQRVMYDATGYSRAVVEDALMNAGVDFFDLYPEFEHERSGPPEPEAWCPGCQEQVLVIRETWTTRQAGVERERFVCAWCSWKMSDGHLNGLEAAA